MKHASVSSTLHGGGKRQACSDVGFSGGCLSCLTQASAPNRDIIFKLVRYRAHDSVTVEARLGVPRVASSPAKRCITLNSDSLSTLEMAASSPASSFPSSAARAHRGDRHPSSSGRSHRRHTRLCRAVSRGESIRLNHPRGDSRSMRRWSKQSHRRFGVLVACRFLKSTRCTRTLAGRAFTAKLR
jgi:hypothetical protein